tara:strand:- start:2499 stop:2765 length:267 start_codon:yes stop_codon:yes gene_type:complete
MSIELKKKIENLDEIHHKKILEIFLKHNIHVSENRNGCFINISNIDKKIKDEINNYIKYIEVQENELNATEQKKQELTKDYFENDIKK